MEAIVQERIWIVMEQTSARSPWAAEIANYHQAEVQPVQGPISGRIHVPGSKSYTNRALIIAGLAQGTSKLTGLLRSDDSFWCLDALQKLGAEVVIEKDVVYINGCEGQWKNDGAELFIGSAGTIARFLPGALAVSSSGSWFVDGIAQLRSRPLDPLLEALQHMGARIHYESDNRGLPLRIDGTGLEGGHVSISGKVSSQFLSGLLICSPYARQKVDIEVLHGLVQSSYVLITTQLMEQFGVSVEHDELCSHFHIEPKKYEAQDLILEADASTACYFLSIAALTGGTVRVQNVGYHSYQPDARFIDVLERMGCSCQKTDTYLEVTGPSSLRGGFDVDMNPMSDQALTVAALAPFADAPICIHNVAHIRKHESDRISVMGEALRKLGIQVDEFDDGLTVHPGQMKGAVLDPHDDHRNAMVYALMGLKVPGITIKDPACVSKTCPTYFTELQKLGIVVHLR